MRCQWLVAGFNEHSNAFSGDIPVCPVPTTLNRLEFSPPASQIQSLTTTPEYSMATYYSAQSTNPIRH